MATLGIIEGFFGPVWSDQARKHIAEQLKTWGGSFYLYAPKRDANLRRDWRTKWSKSLLKNYHGLCHQFQANGVEMGFGLSPFELGSRLTQKDREELREKAQQLSDLGIDRLGLFFDDMKSYDGMADSQLEALTQIQSRYSNRVLFCPSYYSDDPILDKVFGPRPQNYENLLATNLGTKVDVVWTGPKVISPEISKEHLQSVAARWKRMPFLWENLYANDGPKRCELLPLEVYKGRPEHLLDLTTGVGFNPMNEGGLASLMVRHAFKVIMNSHPVQLSHQLVPQLVQQLVGWAPELEEIWLNHLTRLCQGRGQFSDAEIQDWGVKLNQMKSIYADELSQFLKGEFKVGPECLTE